MAKGEALLAPGGSGSGSPVSNANHVDDPVDLPGPGPLRISSVDEVVCDTGKEKNSTSTSTSPSPSKKKRKRVRGCLGYTKRRKPKKVQPQVTHIDVSSQDNSNDVAEGLETGSDEEEYDEGEDGTPWSKDTEGRRKCGRPRKYPPAGGSGAAAVAVAVSGNKPDDAAAIASGPQPLFSKGEKVLCYEPDLKKAQVLYDSKEYITEDSPGRLWDAKVLQVVRNCEEGVVYYEYKIHFQGWKCTWDRYVGEAHVLKSTEENKELQRSLREKIDAVKEAKKKKNRKAALNEQIQEVTKKIRLTTESDAVLDKEAAKPKPSQKKKKKAIKKEAREYSDNESLDLTPSQPLILPDELKKVLEYDFYNVKVQKKWVKIPARITVLELLEEYVRYVGRNECTVFVRFSETIQAKLASGAYITQIRHRFTVPIPRKRNPVDLVNEELDKAMKRINFAKKLAEDIRLLFDVMLRKILLYDEEKPQYQAYMKGELDTPRPSGVPHIPVIRIPKEVKMEPGTKICCALEDKCEYPFACQHLSRFMDDLARYEMIPRTEQIQLNCSPSASYGYYHLLRLFVKVPDILCRTTIPRRKMGAMIDEMNHLLEYFVEIRDIMQDTDWFDPAVSK